MYVTNSGLGFARGGLGIKMVKPVQGFRFRALGV